MSVYDDLVSGATKLSLVGLGYVGMPIALEFAKHVGVVGFDINEEKIALYKSGVDPTKEAGDAAVAASTVAFTSDPADLEQARFHIVAVPTPINEDKTPDLAPVVSASEILGAHLRPGSIVVYESTVYPGVTEGVCVPLLEQTSGLTCGVDFKVGYSPERINPGDKVHTLTTIRKVVSGMDEESLREIQRVYDLVIAAGTHPVSQIKVAEAIKVVENSQRDVNIAFMNELAMVFDRMGIDTSEVVEGMDTKWNALGFRPGLVGGHCIGVDPYYFTYEAEKLGYHSQLILAGRRINDGMGEFVADAAIREMVEAGLAPAKVRTLILGITFKENCPDARNSKVYDIVRRLRQYGVEPAVCDPWADPADVKRVYGLDLVSIERVEPVSCLIVAVAHEQYRRMTSEQVKALFAEGPDGCKVLVDVKSILDVRDFEGYRYWRL